MTGQLGVGDVAIVGTFYAFASIDVQSVEWFPLMTDLQYSGACSVFRSDSILFTMIVVVSRCRLSPQYNSAPATNCFATTPEFSATIA